MKYQELKEFIQKRMRMSHTYQPVMIMALLRHHGKCSVSQIAKATKIATQGKNRAVDPVDIDAGQV
jgi:hypothetical protein